MQLKSKYRSAGDNNSDSKKSDATAIPKYGLKLKLDHVYPEKVSPYFRPGWRVIWHMLPLILRYVWYYLKAKIWETCVVMDYIFLERARQIFGVPIGGIGCGSIGRGFRGEFCRFQLRPGIYEMSTVEANQFIVTIKDEHQETILHSLLSTFPKRSLKAWKTTIDGSKCNYTGLYPRSWTEYDLSEYGIKLVCRQISPVIPHDYLNSSLPCAMFVWDIVNCCDNERTVTVAFTFKNGIGNKRLDRKAACSSKSFSYLTTEGVIMYNTIDKMQCNYVLAAKTSDFVKISQCLYFDPNSDGLKPWIELKNKGEFEKLKKSSSDQIFGEMACGIAVKTTLKPSVERQIEMCLVWDMPTVTFPGKQKNYKRFYTKHFGGEQASLTLANYSMKTYMEWEEKIHGWQKDVLEDSTLPDWYKSALFNETYFITDGGTVWFTLEENEASNLPNTDPRQEYGRFAYLEGHEYIMYNSYDVHFYASHCLHKNWPKLQKSLQYDLRDLIFLEIPDKVKMLYDGEIVERKCANSVPHDAGTPGEEPFLLPNAYPINDVSAWRDLNSKFVLQTYRDATQNAGEQTIDRQFIEDMYDACFTVMHKSIRESIDNDGLIENGGTPDQTYDTWVMSGVSAYCGGLWLAALYAMVEMSEILDKTADRDFFQLLLDRGRISFDRRMWNGLYYNFDSSEKNQSTIQADQLCGHWYLRCCGIGDNEVFPKEKVELALETIYENNVQSFCNGQMGAVNGFNDGSVDYSCIQSQEVWTGVTYALASTMIYEGMVKEGLNTAAGMYKTLSAVQGLSFNTPEALYQNGYYRALGYMRPLSIWSMQMALEARSMK